MRKFLKMLSLISATKLPGQTCIFVSTEDEIIGYTVVFKIPTFSDLVEIAKSYEKNDKNLDVNNDGLI